MVLDRHWPMKCAELASCLDDWPHEHLRQVDKVNTLVEEVAAAIRLSAPFLLVAWPSAVAVHRAKQERLSDLFQRFVGQLNGVAASERVADVEDEVARLSYV